MAQESVGSEREREREMLRRGPQSRHKPVPVLHTGLQWRSGGGARRSQECPVGYRASKLYLYAFSFSEEAQASLANLRRT
ncbi:hypothetical protein NHX12_005643 [Muraenolepis orangiensis]|uniref:Uncharacterized protein n=1 Tax=Muraenolepis orangiensis TaxID=630683 RepID=A0A9Q0ID41_9TELE|nr:hypothetical protein NHX12_005643 [Muraenolepis orangiensis]